MRWCEVAAIFAGIAIVASLGVLWLALNAVGRCLTILRECVRARRKAETEAATAKTLHRAVLAELSARGHEQ